MMVYPYVINVMQTSMTNGQIMEEGFGTTCVFYCNELKLPSYSVLSTMPASHALVDLYLWV